MVYTNDFIDETEDHDDELVYFAVTDNRCPRRRGNKTQNLYVCFHYKNVVKTGIICVSCYICDTKVYHCVSKID